MDNLLSNAVRAGTQAELILEEHRIIVKNDGPPIDSRKLAALNRDLRLGKGEVEGNGFGVSLCHEIARLHKARLKFESDHRRGTVVTVQYFWYFKTLIFVFDKELGFCYNKKIKRREELHSEWERTV